MSLTSRLLTTTATSSPSLPRLFTLHYHPSFLKIPFHTTALHPITPRHVTSNIPNSHFYPSNHPNFTFRASQSNPIAQTNQDPTFIDLDSFLSLTESLCVVSATVLAVGYAVYFTVFGAKGTVFALVFAWGMVAAVLAVGIGAWVRRRQWRRVCVDGGEVNLLERVERLEEDLRSSVTIIRVLSKKLDKLGIRVRVTRKALKTPIAETAALAQKNLEATRALAAQEDILEKELGEIQRVLLAMQEQQEKQLELILAIGKTGQLLENKREPSQVKDTIQTSDPIKGVKELETQETQVPGVSNVSGNDRP